MPAAPDPVATAQAQARANTGTALTQSALNMTNQVTPDYNLNYAANGEFIHVPDGFGGTTSIPRYTATQTLAPDQQQLRDLNVQTDLSMAQTGLDQAQRIGGILGTSIDPNNAPATQGQLYHWNAAQDYINDAGPIRNTIADAGDIQRGFGDAGAIQSQLGDVGDVQRTIGPQWQAGESSTPMGYESQRIRTENALYDRLNPQLEQDRAALETKLINSGYRRGSEAWDNAMQQADQQANDARLGVIRAGGEEQSRLAGLEFGRFDRENAAQNQAFQQELGAGTFANSAQAQLYGQLQGRAQFANDAQAQQYSQNTTDANFWNAAQGQQFGQNAQQAAFYNSAQQQDLQGELAAANYAAQQRDRWFREQFALRDQPINEVTALMSGSQVSQPNFVNTPQTQVGGVDYSGIVNNNFNRSVDYTMSTNAQNTAAANAQMGGLFGLAGTAGYGLMRYSDRRLKRDVEAVGKGAHGLPVYNFRYRWGGPVQVGYMADEVAAVRPDAVTVTPSGFLAVDYGKLEGAL
jgi:hypothetical protein